MNTLKLQAIHVDLEFDSGYAFVSFCQDVDDDKYSVRNISKFINVFEYPDLDSMQSYVKYRLSKVIFQEYPTCDSFNFNVVYKDNNDAVQVGDTI